MTLFIRTYDDPILRQKAKPIEEITQEIKNLIEEMKEWVEGCQGLGLAAPQVGHSLRLFVARLKGKMRAFINPKLSLPSKKLWLRGEACFSIPSPASAG